MFSFELRRKPAGSEWIPSPRSYSVFFSVSCLLTVPPGGNAARRDFLRPAWAGQTDTSFPTDMPGKNDLKIC